MCLTHSSLLWGTFQPRLLPACAMCLPRIAHMHLLLLCPAVACCAGGYGVLMQAAELQRRLEAELPRQQLDLRHRLDKNGQRYGKVIDWK